MIELISYCQKNKDFLPKPEEVARELLRLEKAAAKEKNGKGKGRGEARAGPEEEGAAAKVGETEEELVEM